MTVYEIVADVVGRLEQCGIPYVVGGSLASGAWGQMRQTNDADIAIRLSAASAGRLQAAFADPYLIERVEVESALQSTDPFRTVQLLQMDEAFKIDLFLLGEDAYPSSELERARQIEISPGVRIRFSAPENIVIAKLRWFVLGNRISDRQWNDIVQVLEVQKGLLDEAYLDRWAVHFAVSDLLDQARAQANL